MKEAFKEFNELLELYETRYKEIKSIEGLLYNLDLHINNTSKSCIEVKVTLKNYLLEEINNKNINSIKEDLKVLYKKILSVQNKVKIISSTQPTPVCPICLCKFPNIISINCGHGACEECMSVIRQMGYCHVCRSHITNTIKIHI